MPSVAIGDTSGTCRLAPSAIGAPNAIGSQLQKNRDMFSVAGHAAPRGIHKQKIAND